MEDWISLAGIVGFLYLIHKINNPDMKALAKLVFYRGFRIEKLDGYYYITGLPGEYDTRDAAKEYIDEYLDNRYSQEN